MGVGVGVGVCAGVCRCVGVGVGVGVCAGVCRCVCVCVVHVFVRDWDGCIQVGPFLIIFNII